MICIDKILLIIILAPLICSAVYYWKGKYDRTK